MMTMIFTTLTSLSEHWMLPIVVFSAVVDSLNPCAFSILFLTITFLFSLGKNRKFILLSGGTYIGAIALVYVLIGLGLLKTLSVLNIPNVLTKLGAFILIAYGLLGVINEFFPSFPIKLKIPAGSHHIIAKVIHKGSVAASFVLGVLVGLFEFPCTGGPYLFILSLLHDHATKIQGFGYLVIYNIFFVLPLVVILFLASSKVVTEKIDRFRKLETKKSRVFLSVVLALLGFIVFLFTI